MAATILYYKRKNSNNQNNNNNKNRTTKEQKRKSKNYYQNDNIMKMLQCFFKITIFMDILFCNKKKSRRLINKSETKRAKEREKEKNAVVHHRKTKKEWAAVTHFYRPFNFYMGAFVEHCHTHSHIFMLNTITNDNRAPNVHQYGDGQQQPAKQRKKSDRLKEISFNNKNMFIVPNVVEHRM